MPKKKNKQKQPQKQLSEAAYMKSGRARKLPIHECLVNSNWEESGMAAITVSRTHVNGNISFASYLVDLYCLGVKDAWYRVNIFAFEYEQYLERLAENFDMTKADYANVHNIIYGAVAFAEDYGISPVQEFAVAKMMLEEDTEEIPLIAYEYGVKGKPQLVIDADNPKLSFYLGKLEKHAGKGNYELVLQGDFSEDEEDDERGDEDDSVEYFDNSIYSAEDWEDFILGSNADSLLLTRAESLYIFEKTIAAQTLEEPRFDISKISISNEPQTNHQSEDEIAEAEGIYTSLYLEENSTKSWQKLLQRIEGNIEKWPQNPVFRNYLMNAYAKLEQVNNYRKTTLSLLKDFPNYLFGKLAFAQLLIQDGKMEEVPGVFDGQLFLQSAFPDREAFHFSELFSFNTVMCLYFMKQNKLSLAYAYRKMLADIELPGRLSDSEELFFQIDINAILEVIKLVEAAQSDEAKRQELIATLIS